MGPYLTGLQLRPERVKSDGYPFDLPAVRTLDLKFESPVTLFVGENGTGKSTVMEAIAAICRLPVSGGGRSDLAARHGPDSVSPLAATAAGAARAHRPAHISGPLAVHSGDPLADPDDFSRATILSFDASSIAPIRLEETSHYQITEGILQNPASYWKHLINTRAEAEGRAKRHKK